jgi:hypothetical protein
MVCSSLYPDVMRWVSLALQCLGYLPAFQDQDKDFMFMIGLGGG